jgi:MOSC domain-containing protein YiiM
MFEMKIDVLRLQVSPYRQDKRLVEEVTLDTSGIKDDYHRQKDALVTLLPLETWQTMSKDPNALCIRRFYAHILSSEYENDELLLDTCLKNESVLLQVVSVGKACHKDDGCKYHYSDDGCPLMRKTRFLRILSEGTLSVNDKLEVTPCLNMP